MNVHREFPNRCFEFHQFLIHCQIDIDECQNKVSPCQYMCENQIGSFRCYCPIGFKMNTLGNCQG